MVAIAKHQAAEALQKLATRDEADQQAAAAAKAAAIQQAARIAIDEPNTDEKQDKLAALSKQHGITRDELAKAIERILQREHDAEFLQDEAAIVQDLSTVNEPLVEAQQKVDAANAYLQNVKGEVSTKLATLNTRRANIAAAKRRLIESAKPEHRDAFNAAKQAVDELSNKIRQLDAERNDVASTIHLEQLKLDSNENATDGQAEKRRSEISLRIDGLKRRTKAIEHDLADLNISKGKADRALREAAAIVYSAE